MIKVTFGLSRAKCDWAILSKAIMLAEKRPFSHVYVRFTEPTTGVEIVFHAAKGMVHACSLTNFLKTNIQVKEYEVDFSESQFKDLLSYMYKNSGVKYSYLQIVSITIQKLLKTKGIYKNGEQEQICSELAIRVLDIVGMRRYFKAEDDITPSDFDSWMKDLIEMFPEKIRLKDV